MSAGGADFSVSGKISLGLETHGLETATRSLQGLQQQADKAGASLRKLGDGFAAVGAKSRQIGTTLTAGVTTPLVGLGVLAVNAASDLNESMSAVQMVFGKSADEVVRFSETSATALGISQQATLQAASAFGGLLTGVGLATDVAAKFSDQLIQNASDIVSRYNVAGGAVQVSEQLRAALVGETDGLRQYGIVITEATVQQELARRGQDKLTGSQLEAAKVAARYALIQEKGKNIWGDFAATSGQLAGQLRTAQAQLTEMAAAIGTQLLPLVLRATTALSGLTKRFQTLSPRVKTAILVIAGIAAAVGPLLIVFGSVASAIGALAPVFGLLLGPIGLIILALVALGVAYKTNFLGFGDAVRSVGHVLGDFVKYLRAVNADGDILNDWLSHLPGPIQAVAKLFGRLLNAFKKVSSGFVQMIRDLFAGDFSGAFHQFRKVLAGLGDALSAPAKFIGEFLKGIHTGFAPLDKLIHGIGGLWISFGRLIQEVFQGDFRGALAVGERMLSQFKGVALAAFHLLWIGIVAFARLIAGLPWPAIFGAIGHAIAVVFSRAFDWLKGSGVALMGGLLAGAIDKLPDLLAWLGDLAVTIAPYLADAATWLLDTGIDLITGLISGVTARWPQFTHYLGELLRSLPGYFLDAGFWLFQAGYDLVSGLILGIAARWNDAVNYARALAQAVEDAIKLKWLIGSPSKVFADIGQDAVLGLAKGFKDTFRAVQGSVHTGAIQLAAPITPNLAPLGTSARTVQAGGVVINVSGAGDPAAVANHVYRALDAAFGRLELEARR